MLKEYRQHAKERAAQSIPPKPLSPQQMAELVELLKHPPQGEESFLLELITNRCPAGVDQAAYVKATFLSDLAMERVKCSLIDAKEATKLLGTMLGGYNIATLVDLLESDELGCIAADGLCKTLLVFDAFHDVKEKADAGNANAVRVMQSWADAQWFTDRAPLAEKITVTVFKVPGETNTDDLSPAQDAWSRPDIPLHANAMLKNPRPGIEGDAIDVITELKKKGFPVAYVGDVVGTGSSRKSATNSVLWHMGDDIPFIPNKREGGFCLGGKIAPIFFNTMEDAGALPIEVDVSQLQMGDVIDIYPYEGKICRHRSDDVVVNFALKTTVLLDEVQSNGRIPLIIGRGLTDRTREALGLEPSKVFTRPEAQEASDRGYTLAQKLVGKACGVEGVRPGTYCEPLMATVGSQDTTGPMTRDELKDLACLGFSADLVMQSFCHTAAYPKPVDITTHHSLPDFISSRGGVSLRPGDGIIHSWLNRMLIPDTLGTGGDSHTRFPLGISFPAGSGLVAFAAATGVMPLDMPESVLVRFSGKMQAGVTLRDLVNAIPYQAIKDGLLTVDKKGKKNVFSGRVLEIEGLPDLKVEQAFELSDATAERSAAGCTVKLNKEPVEEYLNSNITLLKWMISEGYEDARTIERRVAAMENWLEHPVLLSADTDAEYAAIIDIDMGTIVEPIVACPNDPDDVKTLSDVSGNDIAEVFIGSCMTNIGHYRAAGKVLEGKENIPTRLWICPPTKMDMHQLTVEGYYAIYGAAGARTEMPGCSLCMGNQARVQEGVTVMSTSTRNFPNRLGKGAKVYLGSAELAAVCSILGRIPTYEEYSEYLSKITTMADDIYCYLNFDQLSEYKKKADKVIPILEA